MKIYDAYVHYLWRNSTSKSNADFLSLRAEGLQKYTAVAELSGRTLWRVESPVGYLRNHFCCGY